MSLSPGDPAPSVSAQNQDGETVRPSFEEPTVVYFYPRDDTPGCTTEATEFTAHLDAYREAGVTVYGVSTDGVDSHAAFAEKHDIEVDLLADPAGEVADAFGVERRRGGATARTTFVLADGRVHEVYTDVDPSGHAREVLDDLADEGLVAVE
jgi:peroxiredoxin Q/BCP